MSKQGSNAAQLNISVGPLCQITSSFGFPFPSCSLGQSLVKFIGGMSSWAVDSNSNLYVVIIRIGTVSCTKPLTKSEGSSFLS